MPLVRSALIATAACLIGAAAYAQPNTGANMPPAGDNQSMPQTAPTGNPPGSSDMNAGGQNGSSMNGSSMNGSSMGGSSMNGSSDMNAAPTGAAANTSATVTTDANGNQVIASQPVPDTRANRAQYGKPMSRAGKRTAPAGN